MQAQAQHLLKSVFGYEKFRLDQEKIIQSVLSGKDTLAIMPTGGGKSLCYQIPALIFPGLTLVISPLISLMKDQVQQLEQLQIPALFLNSSLSSSEYSQNIERLRSGHIKMLYLAPETLFLDKIQLLLSQIKIDCLTIDEAHCISDWGHDFRPEYRKLMEFKRQFPQLITLALTATATEQVRADIQKQLNIPPNQLFVSSFDRHNLQVNVIPKKDPFKQVLEIIERFSGQSGIVYCFSKKQVDELNEALLSRGLSVRSYHAGLKDEERQQNQELFIKDDVHIIVATIAFGMGINKPNVRFVIHYDLPKNIESYYQEIGRAGRDGLASECFLLYSHGDTQKIQYFIQQKSEPEKSNSARMLQQLVRFAETEECKRIELLRYFGEHKSVACGDCSSCLSTPEQKVDLTIAAQKIMSCIKKTGERFGAGYVVDVLRGSVAQKVLDLGHNTLSTHGIGKEYSASQWKYIVRQLVQKEYLEQDAEYGSLKLLANASTILKGQKKFLGLLMEPQKSELRALRQAQAMNELPYNEELFQSLRRFRKSVADAQNVPPYVIYSDKSLMDLARKMPQNLGELTSIYGIGQAKVERYGEQTLALINEFCENNNIERKSADVELSSSIKSSINSEIKIQTTSKSILKESAPTPARVLRQKKALELFDQGFSFEQIALELNVKVFTLWPYFEELLNEGIVLKRSIPLDSLPLSDVQIAQVHLAFSECGTDKLKPVFDHLNEAIDYDSLRLLRLAFLNEKNKGHL